MKNEGEMSLELKTSHTLRYNSYMSTEPKFGAI